MTNTLKLKVGDFYLVHEQWCEVLALSEPNVSYADVTATRVAFAHKDSSPSAASIGTRTYFEGNDIETMTREAMVWTVANCEAGSRTFTCAGLVSAKLGKLNYGSIQDYAAQCLNSERDYWNTGVKSWMFDGEVVRDAVNDHKLLRLILDVYRPFKSVLKDGNITITRNAVDAKRDRQTSMKPGRAFRHMLPWLDDKTLSSITEAWVEHSAPRVFTLKVGKTARDFHRAYDHTRAEYRNPATKSDRKSIASSCMQGVSRDYYADGECVYASVGEAYASGDFAVAWLETSDGFIAGRVVYSDVDGVPHYHGPLYGACEQSLDELQAHLDSIDSGLDLDEWDGLRLAVVGDCDDPIVPYLDGELSGTLSVCGKYIRLSRDSGEFEFDSTDGYTTGGEACMECGDRIDEDDMYFTDDGHMCECCFDRSYVMTEDGVVLHNEEAIHVRSKTRWGSDSEWVHQDNAAYCEPLDEFWHEDDVTYTEDGDECVPTHLIGDFPELFPVDKDEDDLEEAA